MDSTYSDRYALISGDPKAEKYFNDLPGYIQNQILAREHQPANYEDLVRMAEESKKVF